MNVDLSTVSRSKFHPLWGHDLKVALETIMDRDAVVKEMQSDLIPDNCLDISASSKKIYHSAVCSDIRNTDSGETTFLCWADESQAKGYTICFRAKHTRVNGGTYRLLFKNVLFGRFNEEKAWSFERGPFMKLEAFTYKDPFKTLYLKISDGPEVIYLRVDMEMNEEVAVLKAKRVQAEDAPAHLVSEPFPD